MCQTKIVGLRERFFDRFQQRIAASRLHQVHIDKAFNVGSQIFHQHFVFEPIKIRGSFDGMKQFTYDGLGRFSGRLAGGFCFDQTRRIQC